MIENDNVFCSHKSLVENFCISWKSASAAEVNFEFKVDEKILRLKADAWGRAPVFYAHSNDVVLISSHSELLASFLPTVTKNQLAAVELCKKGFLTEGATPWLEIKKLTSDTGLTATPQEKIQIYPLKQLSEKWFTESLTDDWLNEALLLLKNSIVEIVSSGTTAMAVSGGCDSRFILALMPSDIRMQIIAFTKANPEISFQEDNDANISHELIKNLGIRHHLIKNPKNYRAFLVSEETPEVVLSGLYGGEFLGGTLYDMLKSDFLVNFDFSEESLKSFFLATINSSRTVIHDKIDFGWASPYTNLYHARTPYLDPQFLNHLVKLNFSEFRDYQIYNKIWQRPEFEDLAKIPFQSPLTSFFPFQRMRNGVNPKAKENFERETLRSEQLVQENLSFFWNHFYQKEAWYL